MVPEPPRDYTPVQPDWKDKLIKELRLEIKKLKEECANQPRLTPPACFINVNGQCPSKPKSRKSYKVTWKRKI